MALVLFIFLTLELLVTKGVQGILCECVIVFSAMGRLRKIFQLDSPESCHDWQSNGQLPALVQLAPAAHMRSSMSCLNTNTPELLKPCFWTVRNLCLAVIQSENYVFLWKEQAGSNSAFIRRWLGDTEQNRMARPCRRGGSGGWRDPFLMGRWEWRGSLEPSCVWHFLIERLTHRRCSKSVSSKWKWGIVGAAYLLWTAVVRTHLGVNCKLLLIADWVVSWVLLSDYIYLSSPLKLHNGYLLP